MGRAQSIAKLALKYDWRVGAELGVYAGHTTRHLLKTVPRLRMIAVDRWESIGASQKDKTTGLAPYSTAKMAAAEREFLKVQQDYPKRLRVIRRDTIDAALQVQDEELDFVFIDADHSTSAVICDILTWRTRVKPQGAVLGHDADWPSVQAALDRLGLRRDYLPGNVWLCWGSGWPPSESHV